MNECILNSMENGDGKGKSYSWDITRRLVAKGSANQLCCTWWKQYASNQVPGIILHLLQHLSDSGMPHLAVDVTFRNRQFNSQTQFMPQLTRCAKVRLNFSLKHTFFLFLLFASHLASTKCNSINYKASKLHRGDQGNLDGMQPEETMTTRRFLYWHRESMRAF